MSDQKISREVMHLVAFLSFLKQLRHKKTADQIGFFIVNDLYNIVSYRQCMFWEYKNGRVKITNASGQIDVSADSPYIQTVGRTVQQHLKSENLLKKETISELFEQNGGSSAYKLKKEDMITDQNTKMPTERIPTAEHITLAVCYDDDRVLGGLWVDRTKPFTNIEIALIEDTADALSEKLRYLHKTSLSVLKKVRSLKSLGGVVLISLIALMFLPVRLSVTAPAEVVSRDIQVVASPYNGMIKNVMVEPNETVAEGETLFVLDRTDLENDYALAQQKLLTARERLEKTEREFFRDPARASEVNILREEIKLRQLELQYTKELLDQSEIKAPRSGVVLFSDVNDLIGQPVQAGTRVMTLADASDLELLVRIPSSSMIDLSRADDVNFFLNVDPLKTHSALISSVSYMASPDDDGLLSYKARANINNPEDIPRIGLSGTAKLYGENTILLFNLFRRPLIAIRNLLGLGV